MKIIKTLNQLDIINDNLTAHDENVFLRQGSIDGACGPYCVFMALIILGVINHNQATNLWSIKGNSKLGKLIKAMRVHDIFIQNGTFVEDLEIMLAQSYKKDLVTQSTSIGGRKVIDFAVASLRNNAPVIVGIRGIDMAHWLLAVGFEENNGLVSKLFFLNPSGSEVGNYWNSILNTANSFHGIYPYKWETHQDCYVKFEDAISLNLNQNI